MPPAFFYEGETMSIESWKRQYLGDFQEARQSELAAVIHALKKWRGLRASVLARHGLRVDDGDLHDKEEHIFAIDDSSCVVCSRHRYCLGCSLKVFRGGYNCDTKISDSLEDNSPYHAWLFESNPEPMIELLEDIKKWLLTLNKAA
jgi:hypothetical protein